MDDPSSLLLIVWQQLSTSAVTLAFSSHYSVAGSSINGRSDSNLSEWSDGNQVKDGEENDGEFRHFPLDFPRVIYRQLDGRRLSFG